MSREPTAHAANHANDANGIPLAPSRLGMSWLFGSAVGRGADPAGLHLKISNYSTDPLGRPLGRCVQAEIDQRDAT